MPLLRMQANPKGNMPVAMATSSAAPPRYEHRANSVPLLLSPRWREELLRKSKRRPPLLRYGCQSPRHRLQGGSLLGDPFAQFLGLSTQASTLTHAGSTGYTPLRRYDQYPPARYRTVQPFREDDHGQQGCPHTPKNPSRYTNARKPSALNQFVAVDTVRKHHVLLTFVPKAAASARQIDHVQRAMLTLTRGIGFQRLLAIWEHGSSDDSESTPVWVFVQDFDVAWISLDLFCDFSDFTEHTLRNVTFNIVSMVHFLHTHGVSASGQLCANQDFMVNVDTQRVVWLVSPMLVLSGCLLARATSRRRARDVLSIGYLMFHLSMVPHAAALLGSLSNTGEFENVVQEFLSHLSLPCRAMMISCLTESPTIEELVKCKWLRQIEFVSVVPRVNTHAVELQPHRRLMLHSLLRKLSTFFMADWMHAVGATPSAAAASLEEEDVESPRRGRKALAKRQYVGRHVSMNAHYSPHHHYHHGGRAGGGNMLTRGMVIVPPLGSMVLPHGDDDVEKKNADGHLRTVEPHYFVHRDTEPVTVRGTDKSMINAYGTSERKPLYDAFGYDFPAFPLSVPSVPEYDAFDDFEGDVFVVEASALGEEILEDGEGRRSRIGSSMLHENGQNHSLHSMASISDLRSVLRSLHPPDERHSLQNGSDERAELHQFDSAIQARAFSKDGLDPVHLSAFGPCNISFRETFRIDIWAYLRQQRREMLETALEMNESEVGQRVQPMQIARGTLITVSIEPSNQYSVMDDECKSFRWLGEVNGVSFEMRHKRTNRQRELDDDEAEALCIARVAAGTKVSLLFIRLNATAISCTDESTPAQLSTRLEHIVANVPNILPTSLEPLRPIGKGAFGEAMLAVWKERNTHVVIKAPHHDALQADTELLEDFRHEAAVMQMLGKHPHVVELLGVTSPSPADDGFSAIVVEYLPNGSLHDYLTASDATRMPHAASVPSSFEPLSLFSRTVMARDAAHGVVNIHQGHVLHRDIAARNCLLDDQFRVKVGDFGMSRLSAKANCLFFDDEHHGFGPIKWMAPESVLPPHLFSTHSDSYMFGVLMYEIFSGQLPFPGISSRDAMVLVLEGQHVPIPDYLPPTHKELMKGCFDPHPLARPSIDHIFTMLDQWIVQDTRNHSHAPVSVL